MQLLKQIVFDEFFGFTVGLLDVVFVEHGLGGLVRVVLPTLSGLDENGGRQFVAVGLDNLPFTENVVQVRQSGWVAGLPRGIQLVLHCKNPQLSLIVIILPMTIF